jgi:Transglycosylase SLT domain
MPNAFTFAGGLVTGSRRSFSRNCCIVLMVILGASLSLVLSGGCSALAQPAASSAYATEDDLVRRLVDEAALRFGLPAHWIRAVLAMESAGDRWARSPQGAVGLMQLMPDTWTELRSRYGLGADPFEPRDNILAGAAYLREMHDRFGSPGFLAAYNAGPQRYEDHLRTGRALPEETERYVAALAPAIGQGPVASTSIAGRPAQSWCGSSLFAVQAKSSPTATQPSLFASPHRDAVDTDRAGLTALSAQHAGLFPREADRQFRSQAGRY